MQFGKTLRTSIYPPWKDQYIDYSKLKRLMRDEKTDDEDDTWTPEDETRFSEELFNVQLAKVAKFQADTVDELRKQVDANFEKLKDLAPEKQTDGKAPERGEIAVKRLQEIETELDSITDQVRELKKYSNLNYTGFLKIVKKHDRKRGELYRLRPMMKNELTKRPFNSEKGYSPLLTSLSVMYDAIRQSLNPDENQPHDLEGEPETRNGERYTAHKCKTGYTPLCLGGTS